MSTVYAGQRVTRARVNGREVAAAGARQQSVDAALGMIEAGGNAVDAAVAAALVAGVIEPMETTLAGAGHLLVGGGDMSEPIYIDFSARAPLAARPDMYTLDSSERADSGLGLSAVLGDENVVGPLSVGVPGTIAGLLRAHAMFGRLALATVFEPAIRLAHDGFPASPYLALETLASLDQLRGDPGLSKTFLRDGLPPVPAHIGTATFGNPPAIEQPELGDTLERIARHGAGALYGGEVGERLVASLTEAGGIVALEDLRGYEIREGRAASIRCRDHIVWASPGPSGGLSELELLSILNQWEAGELEQGTPEYYRVMAEAGWHTFADRYHWLGDEDYVPVPISGLLSPEYAHALSERIRAGEAPPRTVGDAQARFPWEYYAEHAAHDPWSYDDHPASRRDWPEAGGVSAQGGTTHVAVIDRDGLAVSCTHTAAQHFGSKFLCPRTGLLLNAGMGWFNAAPGRANSIHPGARPVCNMGAVLATQGGAVRAALGAPGGRRIVHAIAQILWHVIEYGMDLQDAIDAPRIDASSSTLLASHRIPGAALDPMRQRGIDVKLVTEEHMPYLYELARPVAVGQHADGTLTGGIDAVTEGYVAVVTDPPQAPSG